MWRHGGHRGPALLLGPCHRRSSLTFTQLDSLLSSSTGLSLFCLLLRLSDFLNITLRPPAPIMQFRTACWILLHWQLRWPRRRPWGPRGPGLGSAGTNPDPLAPHDKPPSPATQNQQRSILGPGEFVARKRLQMMGQMRTSKIHPLCA